MRNEQWHKIWETKGNSDSKDQHVLDGYDLNSKSEYKEIAYSCLTGNESMLSKPNLTTVEFGCGAGAFISALQEKFTNIKIEGVDYSQNLVSKARKLNQQVRFNVLNMKHSIQHWHTALEHKTYDIIFSYGTFLYFNSEQEVLDIILKMKSILSSDGLIILGEINDIDLKEESRHIRTEFLKERKRVTPDFDVDQLYISKKSLNTFARSHNFSINFLSLPDWYSASKYRYHVVLKNV